MPSKRNWKKAKRMEKKKIKQCNICYSDLTESIEDWDQKTPCCHQDICSSCMMKVHTVKNGENIQFKCPFCRQTGLYYPTGRSGLQVGGKCYMKTIMSDIKTHACILQCNCSTCDNKYVLSHIPCDTGCYSCEDSLLVLNVI